MYFGNDSYSVALEQLPDFRNFFEQTVLTKHEYRSMIMNELAKYIDCQTLEFDPNMFQINIAIKKTTMKRTTGFKPNISWYYNKMSMILQMLAGMLFNDPIWRSNAYIQFGLATVDQIYHTLINTVQITCIGEKIVTIKF